MQINLGFKYRLYPTSSQAKALDHQCFVYNQAYNVCLNLQEKQWQKNKDLPKNKRSYMKASEIDTQVKLTLRNRNLPFKTVVTQQARINANLALQDALSVKGKGFPKFKNSKKAKKSFNWNNQGFQIKDGNNPRFKVFRLMNMPMTMRYHRQIPKNAKICSICVSCDNGKYYVSFNVEYDMDVKQISVSNLNSSNVVGIDMNINELAINDKLIDTKSKIFANAKYDRAFVRLQRKQSRRVLLSLKSKQKLGSNFRKTQKKLNKVFERVGNKKKDYYHKLSKEIVNRFDMIAVEDLAIKNITKRAKLKNVKAKSGLNKSILNASFYLLRQMIEYKASHSGKLFTAIPPQYTSKTCSVCGNIKDNLTLRDRIYICEHCGTVIHRDINAAKNILERGLSRLG